MGKVDCVNFMILYNMKDRKRGKILNLIDLEKKKIIVFGASSGIGKTTAIFLSKLGAQVVLVARREKLLQDVVDEMENSGGGVAP